jgi:hypothetical protein
LGKFLWPLLLAYIAFCIMTWIGAPLLNLSLRLHRFGRYVLSREQKIASNCIAALLALTVAGIAVFVVWRSEPAFATALLSFLLIMPTAAIFGCPKGWPQAMMIAAVGVLACMAGYIVYLRTRPDTDGEVRSWVSMFVIGILIASFGSHGLRMAKPRN